MATAHYQELIELLGFADSRIQVFANLFKAYLVFFLLGASLTPSRFRYFLSPIVGQLMFVFSFYLDSALGLQNKIASPFLFWSLLSFGSLKCVFEFRSVLRGLRSFLIIFGLVSLAALYSEWPLPLMRSGDVTAYALQTEMLSRFQAVPWSLPPLGPDSLHYPAGFSLLNFGWTKFSGLMALEVTPLQISIQIALALAALCGFVTQSSMLSAFGAALLFFAFPFFHFSFPDQAGLARAACIAFFGVGLVSRRLHPKDSWLAALSAAVTAFLFAVNPANPLLIGLLVIFGFHRKGTYFQTLCLLLVLSGFVIFGDPYYHSLFLKREMVMMSHATAQPTSHLLATPGLFFSQFWENLLSFPKTLFTNEISSPSTTFVFVLLAALFSGFQTRYWRMAGGSILFILLLKSLVNPAGGFLSQLLGHRLAIQTLWIVWIAQMYCGITVLNQRRDWFIYFRPNNFLRIRTVLIAIWFLTLPWWANFKTIKNRKDWLPLGWDKIDAAFVNDVREWQGRNDKPVLFVPTQAGQLKTTGELFAGAVPPFQIYAFLPNTFVSFVGHMGNKEHSGKILHDLKIENLFDESGNRQAPLNSKAAAWLRTQKLYPWPERLFKDFYLTKDI